VVSGYASDSGTLMAPPHVTGAAALCAGTVRA
jgi:subtilisin family serine protease